MSARFTVGIDLGTTHCAVSYMPASATEGRGAGQAVLPVPQVISPGSVEARPLLPSFLYLASAEEFPAGALGVPWNAKLGETVG
ncbi:MAG: Hsp70 family protein, partial [Archangium sp.]|nr:Hsp70 family protein [Archangium sp.]